MIGQLVNVVLREPDGLMTYVELRGIKPEGLYIYISHGIPESQGLRFFPMSRVVEVIDTGRRP